jgi:cellulose synthase/poly-beta-1,6-N-acetylglucosamine synthase-like glycosyltransferase
VATPGPTVDVVISTFNEERHVGRCLDEVMAQDYPPDRVRVWLVDGGSTDGTVELVRRRAAVEPRLELIADGRRRNLPEALNLAIERSSGELVAKVDAHGYPERDFLSRAVAAFAAGDPELGCVGGMPIQEGETRFGGALAAARGSAFGVGGGTYAIKGDRRFVDSVQCGVYRRAVLDHVGAFDPAMTFGEDDELDWRVVQAGYRILLDRRIRFHYITRPTWRAAYRQYRNYGEARVNVVRRHPGFLRPHHLAPAVFVTGLGALVAGSVASRRARRSLGAAATAYSGAALAAAAKATPQRDPASILRIAAAFFALHAGYGVGMLRRLLRLSAAAPGK